MFSGLFLVISFMPFPNACLPQSDILKVYADPNRNALLARPDSHMVAQIVDALSRVNAYDMLVASLVTAVFNFLFCFQVVSFYISVGKKESFGAFLGRF